MPETRKSITLRFVLILAGVIAVLVIARLMMRKGPERVTAPPSAVGPETAAPDERPAPAVADAAAETTTDTKDAAQAPPADTTSAEHEKLVAGADEPPTLPPSRKAKAEEIFVREREMWARFKGLSAGLEVSLSVPEAEEDIHIKADITMGAPVIIPNPNYPHGEPRWECPMVAKDRDGKWTFTAEGGGKYKVDCDDPQLAKKVEGVMAGIVSDVVLLPRMLLLFLDTGDNLGGPAGIPRDRFFATTPAYPHPDFLSEDDSFLARGAGWLGDNLVFEKGHFAGFRKGPYGREDAIVTYGAYQDVSGDGFWFPTEMSLVSRGGALRATLGFSDVKPELSAPKDPR